ncbi:ketose-bisphosphate aldolase [Bacillus salipaludis]|uniref:ketose-bisphosphate aldolase n=1 Tax=Bacillus salipaludis TaxID=2547811 RepID=UPI002E1A24F7|nr:ketose-bisphosphate aldolase [Bacillus salipaludis]
MPIVSTSEMLIRGKDLKYAVGQFNIINLEFAQSILQAAQEEQSPVILGVSEDAVRNMGGFEITVQMVKELMEENKVTVPVAIHLDNGSSIDNCLQAIRAGFTSVMINGSQYSLEENINLTRRVIEVAHPVGVSVEAKMGWTDDQFLKNEESVYAIPWECKQLVRETGADCLAPSINFVSSPYKEKPNLVFHQLNEVMKLTGVPLVLNNGTGIPIKDIQKAIFFGASKINVNIENHISMTPAASQEVKEQSIECDIHKFLPSARDAIKNTVKGKMRDFGSSGRAQLRHKILYRIEKEKVKLSD